MKETRKRKLALDGAIMLLSMLLVLAVWLCGFPVQIVQAGILLAVLIAGAAAMDWVRQFSSSEPVQAAREQAAAGFAAHELLLLDETDKPVRAWDLTGKTAAVIGRRNRDEEVDIDLGDCEYSALISVQHAVLNYCLDSWHVEDPGSQNGIRIRKVEDGICYQVAPHRPCKLSAGDVIYIAKTRLLFT